MAGLFARRHTSVERTLQASGESWQQPDIQLRGRLSHHPPSGTVCVATARIDNRRELFDQLALQPLEWGAPSPRDAAHDDTHLIHAAYRRWGAACVERIYGDWSFAVWEERSRELFLARDHFGITSLYYCLTPEVFAFATDQRALLDLDLVPAEIDELYVAQVLVAWPAYEGERTVRTGIRRLPPAHTLSVKADRAQTYQYWHLERTPPLRLKDRREYVEGFLEVFDEAVRARLRRDEGGGMGSTLSSGLDSGSITATAARLLAGQGERLSAFTSVPIEPIEEGTEHWIFDEWPLAHATARHAGNVDHHRVLAEDLTPVAGVRRHLAVQQEPCHAAVNAFWLHSLLEQARAAGCSVLLIGQSGNAGISWAGSTWSQPLSYQWRTLGIANWLKESARRAMPALLLKHWWLQRTAHWTFGGSAIRPAFAERLSLRERMVSDPDRLPPRTALGERSWLQPGRAACGARHAQTARAANVEIRDPSGDPRVLAFTWSIPDAIFIDPDSGARRWLIRQAMAGRLPDQVRWNTQRGWQAADLPERIRRSSQELEDSLMEIEGSSTASTIVDPIRLRAAWGKLATENDPRARAAAGSVLMRGLMAGLFLKECVE